MKNNLRKELAWSYIIIALLCVTLISVTANFFLKRQFNQYVTQNNDKNNKDLVSSVSKQYVLGEGWNVNGVENLGIDALNQGSIISLKDSGGKTIWDATVYDNGMCKSMLQHISENMMKEIHNWKGCYVENSYPVMYGKTKIGELTIGFYGPFYYTDEDVLFINTLNRIIIIVGVISLLVALIMSLIMTRAISRPILKVIAAAGMISKGNYHERIKQKSDIQEINTLTTSINELAEGLEKQELLRKRLTSDVAHELRTPLTTLQSHMEAILDGIWEPTPERIESCHEEIMRINRMIGDLEKLAEAESENLILLKSEFDLGDLINKILMNFQSEFKAKDIKLCSILCETIVNADKDKMSQVIINLLSNALKYTPEGGKVEIENSVEASGVRMRIKDSGMGISKEDLPYIFERFYRADKSRSRLTGGAGIGLTITKSIIEAHKGSISVKSEIGAGTEFTVFLP